jgi:choline-sulfatase
MNVLVLMGDDHAPHAYGAYGSANATTPNLDRLAESGIRFENAFCNAPVCTATRQSLLTGRMPHSIGVTQLSSVLKDETVTIADNLKERGYNTAAFGKMHFNSNLKHGFDRLLYHNEHQDYLKQHPPKNVPTDIEVLPQWKPFRDHARVWLNSMNIPFGAYDQDMYGTWIANQTREYLNEQKDKPFCLFTSFDQPHSPFRYPIEYSGMFDPESFDIPKKGPDDDWHIPDIFYDLTEKEAQGITAAYYTATAFMDKNMGIVLDALEENGLSDNTLVVYVGDHGYALGPLGRFEKHTMFEESVHSPLVFRVPGITEAGSTTSQLTEFIDIYPTIMEAVGAPIPDEVEGKSLLPILNGDTSPHREMVFSEYFENEEAMIRTTKYKYIYGSGKRMRQDGYLSSRNPQKRTRLLYDLETDPNEHHNLAGNTDYDTLINEFENEMIRRFQDTSPVAERMPDRLIVPDQIDFYLKAWDQHL